jgi:hypothetical protein
MSIRIRRGTDAERLTIVLEEGEFGYATDTKKVYIGDGITFGGNEISSSINLEYRHDFNIYDYLGKAPSGSSESASVWTITRLTIASDGTTTSGIANNVSWSGRYTHIYT